MTTTTRVPLLTSVNEALVLAALRAAGSWLGAPDLRSALEERGRKVDKGQVSRLASRLEVEGFLKSRECSHETSRGERKGREYQATSKGFRTLQKLQRAVAEYGGSGG